MPRRTIWKFPFTFPQTTFRMSATAAVLHCDFQGEDLNLWVFLDPAATDQIDRTFHAFGTGHPVPERNLSYVGTVLEDAGRLVWHLFEEVEHE